MSNSNDVNRIKQASRAVMFPTEMYEKGNVGPKDKTMNVYLTTDNFLFALRIFAKQR